MAKQRTTGEPIVFRLPLHYDLDARQRAGEQPIHHYCRDLLIWALEQHREREAAEAAAANKRPTTAFLGSYAED